jgi:tRNA threonylcarbamoyladenosine biosynthesis protein TsaB
MPSSAPVLLSLDTATDRIHAALTVGEALSTLDLAGGAQASTALLPALNGLLQSANLAWADVSAVAFGSGPGAFTGLRTACSITQGLALGLGCPVISLDTLMAVAEDARLAAPASWAAGDTLWVLQDARMSELYVGAFTWTGDGWQVAQPAQLWPLDEPLRRWAPDGAALDPNLRWAGNASNAYPDLLGALNPRQALSNEGEHAAPRGAALAALARGAWERGDTVDAALALPRYVRDKVAQTTAERQAIAQARDASVTSRASDQA